MLKEGDLKESRGWIYRELEFDISSKEIEEDQGQLKGEQIGMFE